MSYEVDIARWLARLTGDLRGAIQTRTRELEAAIEAARLKLAELERGTDPADEVAALEREVAALADAERSALRAAADAEALLRDRLAETCLRLLDERRARALAAQAATAGALIADVGETLGIDLAGATLAQAERRLDDAHDRLERIRLEVQDRLRTAAIQLQEHPGIRERLAGVGQELAGLRARVAAGECALLDRHAVDGAVLDSIAKLGEAQMHNARRDLLTPFLEDRAIELEFDLAADVLGLAQAV